MLGSITPNEGCTTRLLGKRTLSVEMYEDLEPEAAITEVQPLQYNRMRRLLFWLAIVLTAGVFFLLDRWFLRLHQWSRYTRAPLEKATHVRVSTQYSTTIVQLNWTPLPHGQKALAFTFQYLPYYYDGGAFRPLVFPSKMPNARLIDRCHSGHSSATVVGYQREVFGNCQINVPLQSCCALFLTEFLNPFYLFQVFSVALWFWDGYYYYAAAICLTTAISLATSLYQTRKNMVRVHEMAKHCCAVRVKRAGEWTEIQSVDLVPGDLIEIPTDTVMPCDAALLSGGCVVEEGMLTGESVPVLKDPLPYSSTTQYNILTDKRHSLYEGTHVIQTRSLNNSLVTGLVVRTGFQTTKGKLVRSILFPRPNKFKFYRDAMVFIAVLAIIAVLGFCAVLPLQIYQGVPVEYIIDRSLDLLTVSVPPALPAAMGVGTSFALFRLKAQGINCISPPRVNVSGKIDTVVFDKTGTLTEDGMNLLGVNAATAGRFLGFAENLRAATSSCFQLIECMATCHSLTVVNGRLMGDSQDLQIFHSTGWIYEFPDTELFDPVVQAIVREVTETAEADLFDIEDKVVALFELGHELGILHIFHFTSKLKRMGVIVKNLATGSSVLYMKGAPEVMLALCDPATVPQNVSEELALYTVRGLRVLACACCEVDIDYVDLGEKTLDQLESNLTFLGLVVLQNKLKPETVPEIHKLQAAKLEIRMATGDALLTAISVARECGILDADPVLGEVLSPNQVTWSMYPVDPAQQSCITSPPWDSPRPIALTGEAFACLSNDPQSQQALLFILQHCQVYARMAPDHKTLLVERLQQQGHLVGMCGDGANDCGALKTADIGISLSEAETSIAAPFTSATANISCVDTVLREGRCALVTSTQIFKFIALNSTIQFVSVCLLYGVGSSLSDYQFLCIDLFTVLPLAITMSYTKPYHVLSDKSPLASLISLPVLASVIGQTVLCILFQVLGYLVLREMAFFEPNHYVSGEDVHNYFRCQENTVIFLISWFQYVSVCMVYSIGKPWKKPAHTNMYLTVNLAVLLLTLSYCILWPASWIRAALVLEDFPMYFRSIILAGCLLYALISYIGEKCVVTHLTHRVNQQVAIQ